MQPTYITINTLFSAQRRYTVPLFQRPYVWGREAQWEPLWQDIEGLLERTLSGDGSKMVAGHFLGTVVLEQVQTSVATLERREVIDGQQRLTTLQLALKAAEHALAVLESTCAPADKPIVELERQRVSSLTTNLGVGEERYKVWPTNEDRDAFRFVMDTGAASGAGLHGSRMAEAYRYFRNVFLEWLTGPGPAVRAKMFSSALRDNLRLIVLDLDDTDEPQAIFETLNAHGTPLLPADLIKNWLLWEAARQHSDGLPLYQDYWSAFDRDHAYWRAEVGTGHAARARVDTFLLNWLTRKTRQPVSAKHLYDKFLHYANELAKKQPDGRVHVSELMTEIADDAQRYRTIDECSADGRFGCFLRRLKTTEIVVFHPVVMELMSDDAIGDEELARACSYLESYLVRRMICGYQTRGYGTLALTLLDALADRRSRSPSDVIAAALQAEPGTSNEFPTEVNFAQQWRTRRFYGALRRDRITMLLQAIEERLQQDATKAEPILHFDYDLLQIEHVMPRSWQQHWPVDPARVQDRENLIHSIGNLTLVSKALNPSISNAPWLAAYEGGPSKKTALDLHSKLELNARLVSANPLVWNEESILRRADWLLAFAAEIWPLPSSPFEAESLAAE